MAARWPAWVELHIEQGPVLVARQIAIGIVTGIRGNIRHRVVQCIGEAGHSGAVPRWLRRDAVVCDGGTDNPPRSALANTA